MQSAIDKSGFRLRLLPLMLRYHSVGAAKRRTTAESLEGAYGSLDSLEGDLAEIRDLFHSVLDNQGPQVTVVIPAYNEEVELVPTLLSFLWAIGEGGIPTEVVVVDNLSTDRSRYLLDQAGVKVVDCDRPGLRFARAAGLGASHPHARYVWLVDADTRLLPPIRNASEAFEQPNPLLVSYRQMESHPDCVATSTGIVYEYQVPLRKLLRRLRLLAQGGLPYSCWTGPNQFIRKSSLLAVGGIDLSVDGGEDHHRIFELVRYGKEHGMYVRGADRDKSLLAPVFASDRRNSTLVRMLRNITQQHRKPAYATDRFGLPVHPKGVRYKDLFRRERGRARADRES